MLSSCLIDRSEGNQARHDAPPPGYSSFRRAAFAVKIFPPSIEATHLAKSTIFDYLGGGFKLPYAIPCSARRTSETLLCLGVTAPTRYVRQDWWFQIFFFHPDPWGNDPIWRAYFSIGLKPPTSLWIGYSLVPKSFSHSVTNMSHPKTRIVSFPAPPFESTYGSGSKCKVWIKPRSHKRSRPLIQTPDPDLSKGVDPDLWSRPLEWYYLWASWCLQFFTLPSSQATNCFKATLPSCQASKLHL